jgi:hypothetical protein
MITVHTDTVETKKETFATRKGPIVLDRTTVEITIKGDRRRVRCHRTEHVDGFVTITIFDLAVRFPTGAKVWPASAVYWSKTGVVNNLRPNIDKWTGQNCSLLGYIADHLDSKHLSKHNAC